MTTKNDPNKTQEPIDVLELLKVQHRAVERLFASYVGAETTSEKRRLFAELADSLAMHATIEEVHFYPQVRQRRTEEILLEAVEEHLQIKRILADLLELEVDDPQFAPKMKVLQEEVEHHVEEEEQDLFPKVEKIIEEHVRAAIAQEMIATMGDLEGKSPRFNVRKETEEAAPIE